MNGIEKAAIQRALGTRSVIEDIDQLRILYGCSSVQVLTPIVETKLRAGTIPLKSLHLRLDLNDTVVDNRHLYDKSNDSNNVDRNVDGDDITRNGMEIFDIYLNIIYSIKQNNILINMKLDWKNNDMKCGMLQDVLDRYCQQINNNNTKDDDEQVCTIKNSSNLTKKNKNSSYNNNYHDNNCCSDTLNDGDGDADVDDVNHNINIELVSTVDVVNYIMQVIMEVNGRNNDNNRVTATADDSLGDDHKRNSADIDIVDDDDDDDEEEEDGDDNDQEVSDNIYTCRRCNQVLFAYNDLHEHSLDRGIQSSCTSYYLEDYPNWIVSTSQLLPPPSSSPSSIDDHLNQHQVPRQPYCASPIEASLKDKIHCLKCKSRIGSYSWSGSQCSCFEWVIPSFQFIKSKIDCKRRAVTK